MDTIEIYPAADGRRWRRIAPNGRIVAEGGQGYSRTIDAMTQVARTQKPPYLFRNLVTGNSYTVRDSPAPWRAAGEQAVHEEQLVAAGEANELDMPEPPDLPLQAPATCEAFEWSAQNLRSCATCRRPFWEHTHKATSFGNQPISDEERAAVKAQAEKDGGW